MYKEYITSQDEAVCHLFLHCCFKDGVFSKDEINAIASRFVDLQIQKDLNFKQEIQHYKTYINDIKDEEAYLQHIFHLINAAQTLALYFYCAELCLSDKFLSTEEASLLSKIAALLQVSASSKALLDKLAAQCKTVETEKIF
ncbi:MAG: TerB family tellurite resistance protein [Bacteroidetes bacterium]|nr:TerB family tellurite resistance protein [Bacteroidota bacterium]